MDPQIYALKGGDAAMESVLVTGSRDPELQPFLITIPPVGMRNVRLVRNPSLKFRNLPMNTFLTFVLFSCPRMYIYI